METVFPVENLDGGLRAAFIHLPHLTTSAVRLTVNSGSLHEDAATTGAAHYLEHITFEGTEIFPTEVDIYNFSQKNIVDHNASTGHTAITYYVNAHDLTKAGQIAHQLVFAPRLEVGTVEKERKPILNEILRDVSNPYNNPHNEYMTALGGKDYGRPIYGTFESVADMTYEDIASFYHRNYRLGNTVLTVASSETPEYQKDFFQNLLSDVDKSRIDEPTPITMPTFNPEGLLVAVHPIDLAEDTVAQLNLDYGVEETSDDYEQFGRAVVVEALKRLVLRKLRFEMSLCYGASAYSTGVMNRHFGAYDSWSTFGLTTEVAGPDAATALEAMFNGVVNKELPEETVEAVLKGSRLHPRAVAEKDASSVVDYASSVIGVKDYDEVDIGASKRLAERSTVEGIRKIHRDMTDAKPLVSVTSSDTKVGDMVGEWAASRIGA